MLNNVQCHLSRVAIRHQRLDVLLHCDQRRCICNRAIIVTGVQDFQLHHRGLILNVGQRDLYGQWMDFPPCRGEGAGVPISLQVICNWVRCRNFLLFWAIITSIQSALVVRPYGPKVIRHLLLWAGIYIDNVSAFSSIEEQGLEKTSAFLVEPSACFFVCR